MINTEIRYEGKKYQDINDSMIQAGIDEINKYFDTILKPFESEISEHGGLVVLDIKKDFDNAEISFHNLPDELTKQISAAFTN